MNNIKRISQMTAIFLTVALVSSAVEAGVIPIIDLRINNGKIVGSPVDRMKHETIWYSRPAGEAPSRCGSASEGWPNTVGGRRPAPCLGEFGVSLVAGVSTRGPAWAARQAGPGTAPRVVSGPEGQAGAAAREGSTPGWVPYRSLDLGPRGRADPPRVRHSLSSRSHLEAANQVGLELPEAGAACGGAG
jgi:hypothetical protein